MSIFRDVVIESRKSFLFFSFSSGFFCVAQKTMKLPTKQFQKKRLNDYQFSKRETRSVKQIQLKSWKKNEEKKSKKRWKSSSSSYFLPIFFSSSFSEWINSNHLANRNAKYVWKGKRVRIYHHSILINRHVCINHPSILSISNVAAAESFVFSKIYLNLILFKKFSIPHS